MKYKVIFDTNSIRNAESVSDFLGGRADLERFLKVADLVIPDLVIEEIKVQKRKHLISKRDSFLSNPFHFLRKVNEGETKEFDIDKWILGLFENERIPYSLISLSSEGVLEKIKRMCLECAPPFEEGSDRGFKDAYIYFTVLEFLNACEDKVVFVVTKDNGLREALSKEGRIKVVKDFEEFEKYVDDYFRAEYFISRLKEEINSEIDDTSIEDAWLNIDGNWVLKVICNENVYFVEVDFASREILEFIDSDFSAGIEQLTVSGSFSGTHGAVSEIANFIKYFSDDDVQKLIKAATENEQIYWIASDEDVKDFFIKLYQAKHQIIPGDIKSQFEQYFIKL